MRSPIALSASLLISSERAYTRSVLVLSKQFNDPPLRARPNAWEPSSFSRIGQVTARYHIQKLGYRESMSRPSSFLAVASRGFGLRLTCFHAEVLRHADAVGGRAKKFA